MKTAILVKEVKKQLYRDFKDNILRDLILKINIRLHSHYKYLLNCENLDTNIIINIEARINELEELKTQLFCELVKGDQP